MTLFIGQVFCSCELCLADNNCGSGQLWVDQAALLNLAGFSYMSRPLAGTTGLTQLQSIWLMIHQAISFSYSEGKRARESKAKHTNFFVLCMQQPIDQSKSFSQPGVRVRGTTKIQDKHHNVGKPFIGAIDAPSLSHSVS